ncbi:hypothetical protein JL720_4533 [Aureococcus anophagefferens]|nr:hypothetical protein JL720_4533 [Aureococcus anophagefferens]
MNVQRSSRRRGPGRRVALVHETFAELDGARLARTAAAKTPPPRRHRRRPEAVPVRGGRGRAVRDARLQLEEAARARAARGAPRPRSTATADDVASTRCQRAVDAIVAAASELDALKDINDFGRRAKRRFEEFAGLPAAARRRPRLQAARPRSRRAAFASAGLTPRTPSTTV